MAPDDIYTSLPDRLPNRVPIRLHYIDWGGSGRPLILLHGLSSSARIWDFTAPLLAEAVPAGRRGFRVLALDQRGHGLSDVPEDGYTFADVTGDLAAFIDTLGLERPVVAGHSWGASVAVQLAADHPDAVQAIVLVDGGFGRLSAAEGMTWEKAQEMMRPPEINGVPLETFLSFARNWPDFKDLWSDQLQGMFLSNFRIEDGRVHRRLPVPLHMKIVRAIWDQGSEPLWARISCAVLMVPAITSGNERTQGWNERKLEGIEEAQGMLRDAQVVRMEDTIHDIPIQRPKELAQAIIDFAGEL